MPPTRAGEGGFEVRTGDEAASGPKFYPPTQVAEFAPVLPARPLTVGNTVTPGRNCHIRIVRRVADSADSSDRRRGL